MIRKIAVLAVLWCAACYSSGPSLGTCNVAADCTLPDGGQLAGVTCNQNHVCAYACSTICAPAEACVNAACELQGPRITSVSAPTTWTQALPSQPITVTAVIDDTGGPGINTATLRITGGSTYAGTPTSGTALVRTFTFSVPSSIQAVDTETPIAFTVIATDTGGGTTPDRAAGTGQLLIDGRGPTVNGVTVNGGVAVQQIKWFPQSQTTPIDVQVAIQDNGSGVQPSSLTLVAGVTPTRIDAGSPTCTGSNPTLTCHFSVTPLSIPTSVVPTGGQRQLQFSVAGNDVAGNSVRTNQAAVGIDGMPPTIAFTVGAAGSGSTTSYPVVFADCNGGTTDGTMYCGHDGSHFWRAGDGKYNLVFTVSDTFTAPNDVGSGASTSASTCSVAGSTAACTVTFNASNNTFTFPANFATATFTSIADGTGTVSVTVNAKDAVGNSATPVTITGVKVTRVKWMRSMTGKVDTFKGSPVVTSTPTNQIIFGGTEQDTCPPTTGPSTCGPILGLAEDGQVLWRTGHNEVDKIGTNLVYSSITRQLYVVVDPAVSSMNTNKMFAYHVGSAGTVDGSLSCAMVQGVNAGKVFGSPAILSDAGTEYALVSDQTLHRLWAFSGAAGIGCSGVSTNGVLSGNVTAWAGIIQPPSTNGQAIYLGHGTTVTPGLSRVAFTGGNFSSDTEAASFTPRVSGTIAISGNIFFGDAAAGKYFSYDATTLTAITQWGSGAGAMLDALTSSPVLSTSHLFGVAGSGDGRLRAFNRADGTEAFHFPPGTTAAVGAFASPAIGADNVIYASEASGPSLQVISPNGSGAAAGWSPYQGATGTSPATNVDSITTEATLDSRGVMYFGTLGGKVF